VKKRKGNFASTKGRADRSDTAVARKKKPNRIIEEMKRGGPIERLYAAVAEYVDSCGGNVVVVGAITIIQWPDDLPGNFTVGVRCTGAKPVFAKDSV
jgi:hypothetical protein